MRLVQSDVDVQVTAGATQGQITNSSEATGQLTLGGRTFTITGADGQTIDNVTVAVAQGASTVQRSPRIP